MKKIISYVAAFMIGTLTTVAMAQTQPLGSACWRKNGNYLGFSGTNHFVCPKSVSQENVTIEQLYAMGYRVVTSNIDVDSDGNRVINIVIEKISLGKK